MIQAADATRIRYATWPRPRPLPRRVQPFPDETAGSYLDRVADANLMDTRDLRIYLLPPHGAARRVGARQGSSHGTRRRKPDGAPAPRRTPPAWWSSSAPREAAGSTGSS